jgi:hypothetical protein
LIGEEVVVNVSSCNNRADQILSIPELAILAEKDSLTVDNSDLASHLAAITKAVFPTSAMEYDAYVKGRIAAELEKYKKRLLKANFHKIEEKPNG